MEGHRGPELQVRGQALILHPLLSVTHDVEMPVNPLIAQPGGRVEETRNALDRGELAYKQNSLRLSVTPQLHRREKHAGVGNIRYNFEAPAQPIAFNRIL